MLDIDNFSHINDTLGHDFGDAAIRGFAASVIRLLRDVDLCGRFGGDEFMVLLPDTAAADAAAVSERMLQSVRSGKSIPAGLTCSIGVASSPAHGWTAANLVSAADQALLEAKRRGKDRVVVFEGGAEASGRGRGKQKGVRPPSPKAERR